MTIKPEELTEVIGNPPRKLPKPPPAGFYYEWTYGDTTKRMRATYAFELDGPGDGEEHVYEVEMEYGEGDWRHDDFLLYCASWKSQHCSLLNEDTEGVLGASLRKIHQLLASPAPPQEAAPVESIVLDGATESARRRKLSEDLAAPVEGIAGTLIINTEKETVTFTPVEGATCPNCKQAVKYKYLHVIATGTSGDAMEHAYSCEEAPAAAKVETGREESYRPDFVKDAARFLDDIAKDFDKLGNKKFTAALCRQQASQLRSLPAATPEPKLTETREIVSLLLWKIKHGQGSISIGHYACPLRASQAELDALEAK